MKKNKDIKVLFKPVDGQARVYSIPNTLEAMQLLVGGYIETVTVAKNAVIVCNEEGLIRGLKPNRFLGFDFVGDVFACGRRGDAFTDVPKALITMAARETEAE